MADDDIFLVENEDEKKCNNCKDDCECSKDNCNECKDECKDNCDCSKDNCDCSKDNCNECKDNCNECKDNCDCSKDNCNECKNKLFVILINDEPFFYTKTEKNAQDKIIDLAKEFCIDPNWTYYVNSVEYNVVKITRKFKYYPISYEQPYKIISYDEIEEI